MDLTFEKYKLWHGLYQPPRGKVSRTDVARLFPALRLNATCLLSRDVESSSVPRTIHNNSSCPPLEGAFSHACGHSIPLPQNRAIPPSEIIPEDANARPENIQAVCNAGGNGVLGLGNGRGKSGADREGNDRGGARARGEGVSALSIPSSAWIRHRATDARHLMANGAPASIELNEEKNENCASRVCEVF